MVHVVIVVRFIPRTNAHLIQSPASNVTELVIMPLTSVPVLTKIQGNLPGFMVEHPVVEDSLQEDKSMKQLRSLKPSLTGNLT